MAFKCDGEQTQRKKECHVIHMERNFIYRSANTSQRHATPKFQRYFHTYSFLWFYFYFHLPRRHRRCRHRRCLQNTILNAK